MHMFLFYFICYFSYILTTSKVPEQDASNLTKAGFVITTSLQPASFRSGCKERLISKPVYDRGQSRNFSGGFVEAGFDALVNSFPARSKNQDAKYLEYLERRDEIIKKVSEYNKQGGKYMEYKASERHRSWDSLVRQTNCSSSLSPLPMPPYRL